MRKLTTIALFVLGIFFWSAPSAKAQYSCTDWGECTSVIDPLGGTTSTCECISVGDDGTGGPITCSSGYYVCNKGCCPIGESGSGGWKYKNTIYGPSCPANTARDLTQLLANNCVNQGAWAWMSTGQSYQLGSSQAYSATGVRALCSQRPQ